MTTPAALQVPASLIRSEQRREPAPKEIKRSMLILTRLRPVGRLVCPAHGAWLLRQGEPGWVGRWDRS